MGVPPESGRKIVHFGGCAADIEGMPEEETQELLGKVLDMCY